jgi:hypothetical protein
MRSLRVSGYCVALLVACSGGAGTPDVPVDKALRTYYVATGGSDSNPGTLQRPFRTIQHGLDVATQPGDVVRVRRGTYDEGITFPASGAPGRPIVLESYSGERPAISGDRGTHQKLVRIFNRSHVRFIGFDVGRLAATSPLQSGAIFVEGYGDDVVIAKNFVHDVRPKAHVYANGRAIQVRGFYADRALTNVVVANNEIVGCTVQDGNVLEISGNSSHVRVQGNVLRSNRGIALNVTGGTRPPAYKRWSIQVRDVLVVGNDVEETLGAGAIGLYIQASSAVQVRGNRVAGNAWGIYVTSEYPGVHSENVAIAENFVHDNLEAGLLVGSPFFPTTVLGATVEGNVVVHNGAFEAGNGGNFGVGRARGVTVRANHFIAADAHVLTYLGAPYQDVTLDRNCYDDPKHDPARARFGYAGKAYVGFARYQAATGQDRASTFGPSCN